jgi:hypothetical protein
MVYLIIKKKRFIALGMEFSVKIRQYFIHSHRILNFQKY